MRFLNSFIVTYLTLSHITGIKAEWATIAQITMNKLNSETLPGNLLPNFLFMQGAIEGNQIIMIYSIFGY